MLATITARDLFLIFLAGAVTGGFAVAFTTYKVKAFFKRKFS